MKLTKRKKRTCHFFSLLKSMRIRLLSRIHHPPSGIILLRCDPEYLSDTELQNIVDKLRKGYRLRMIKHSKKISSDSRCCFCHKKKLGYLKA